MSLKISWSIEGEQQLSRRLRKIGDGVKDWTPALEKASTKLKSIFSNEVFNTRGAVIGETWAALKPTYLAQKRKKGFPDSPLIKTGIMKDSFYTEVNKDYAIISNRMDYFKYHQSNKPRSKIPRRVMMKIDNPQKTMIVREFQIYWYKLTH